MNLDAKIRKVSRQHEKIIVFLVTKKGWKNQPSNSISCGERGIRTPGTLLYNGFQDRRDRPLCHFSAAKIQIFLFLQTFFQKKIFFIKNTK